MKFASDNNLLTSDLLRLNDVVTYINDDGSKMSWIDHILSSIAVDNIILSDGIKVLNDIIVSV